MVATSYTAIPLPSQGMGNGIHNKDPKAVLARNLKAAFKKRGLSARSVERAIKKTGRTISNKTVSNMLNGVGNPAFENLLDVAEQARIPLWQLLCPTIEISHVGKDELHELLEGIVRLSDTGRAQVRRTIRAESLLAADSTEASSTT